MTKERKRYSSTFKLKAVLAVLKGDKTAAQLAGELEVHPMMILKVGKILITVT